ncbi:hypothetical protein NMY22_g19647 [Coprinellus aureogranulatus]|nr:hypothetical protein NMY22_g19647 [Coprinellus aureogranulatus]
MDDSNNAAEYLWRHPNRCKTIGPPLPNRRETINQYALATININEHRLPANVFPPHGKFHCYMPLRAGHLPSSTQELRTLNPMYSTPLQHLFGNRPYNPFPVVAIMGLLKELDELSNEASLLFDRSPDLNYPFHITFPDVIQLGTWAQMQEEDIAIYNKAVEIWLWIEFYRNTALRVAHGEAAGDVWDANGRAIVFS